ncbi:NADH dehydrogenase [ubiquinone] 1 alpha subcomplex assembly factor 4-like isoform X1 [Penaeus indicus]|uniref:NADH dehydrogenase [ubiquinone] 1 alpha subcomplex assembly factor 4-like isoform X1 n=2 Tax=Penaeus indicus TaxID=29960 RepID=UPI00300D4DAD
MFHNVYFVTFVCWSAPVGPESTEFRRMGKVMSALGRRATKPIRDFNIESRAHREITKEKRPVAPRHESTRLIIEESIRNQPEEVKKSLEQRDDILLNRLKQIYVTSEDPMPTKEIPDNPERSLPSDRSYVADPEYGFYEPKAVPYGKITLRNALHAIGMHQQDPEQWTAKKIAYEYKIDEGLTEKVLRHFRTFVLIVPDDVKKKRITSEVLRSTPLVAPHSIKQLPAGSSNAAEKDEKAS